MTALSRLGLTSNRLSRLCCSQWTVRFLSDSPYQEKKLNVVTCRHLFPKSKDKGLDFVVTYIDEQPPQQAGYVVRSAADDSPGRLPVVLMLHGSPGSYLDFNSQVECLVRRGCRVLAPNFPDLPTIRKYRYPAFRNTPLNKSSLVRDFLKAVGIDKVDMLVTHSSGTYAGLRLYRSPELPDIDAFAMINPAGHWHTCTNPRWFYQTLGELVHWRLGYGLFNLVGMKIFPLLGPVDVPNIDEPLLSLTAIRSFNLKEVAEGLREVEARRPPLLFTFSENDKLIGRKVSYDMLRILGCDRKDWWFYDEKGELKTEGKSDDWIKAISFQVGSHYSFKKHANVTNQALLELFNRLPISRTTVSHAEMADYRQAETLEQKMEKEKNRIMEQERSLEQFERTVSESSTQVPRINRSQENDSNAEFYQDKQKIRL